jgi:hypothetical protein
MSDNPFVGRWTYRSFLNDPDIGKAFNDLEFGRGTIEIVAAPVQILTGTIGGPGVVTEAPGFPRIRFADASPISGRWHRRRRTMDL